MITKMMTGLSAQSEATYRSLVLTATCATLATEWKVRYCFICPGILICTDCRRLAAWDHYQKYGANSGTIWHSELCNTDGTNKRSTCDVFHTNDQYEYQFLSEKLGPEKAITFSVRAQNDAHIGFFQKSTANEGRSYTAGPTLMDYTSAKAYCVSQGGTLASIHTPLEQAQVWKACKVAVAAGAADGPGSCWRVLTP
jgi:hypothetical protein